VLRFNTRGTTSAAGTSEGQYDEGKAEGKDLAAAIAFAIEAGLPNIWLVGWSFGTNVVLRHGNVEPVRGAFLLSPTMLWSDDSDLLRWAESGRPLTALVPELDDYLKPAEAVQRFAIVPQCEVLAIAECKHLWVGEKFVRIAWNEILKRALPDLVPLTWTWDGPMSKWDDLAGHSV
jgi:alpha/beta superfamily hydrolase